ncbi:MAG: heme ABC transporter ATP-binding protein [Thermoproteota archaeon]|uniref:ABC transporter ATP-binding protein n=1 Tax=Candidatus Methanodesulfokora washburnensis TaxID=2478471 RepID=A0A3R9QV24_9CREN|nr:ABC transporter ATP-binding protein [Candidatus Methanodesulfokores washburnensis]RZN62182.1 MAG: ABC transporter ATP-binding protein [Candidatus Methanodesulfokores washburnensis]TDA40609.1 MAG: heme ABC transporter ATP-binding protein [Candidatus Korarchaeota archaeon]
MLKVCNIECYYESTKVLDGISFSINPGDFVGVLGPNGSGKTTLLRALSRVLKPRIGAVFLEDSNIYLMKNREVAKNIAVVPQDAAPAGFNLTVLDFVLMGRHPHMSRFKMESEKDFAIAKRAMEMTNTLYLAGKNINELSGGERQRVLIARALTQEPKVLLLDEPTSHLDVNNQLEIMELLKRLCLERKMAVLAVLHDFNIASHYCDSLILLNGGRIVSMGAVDDVLTSENIKKVFQVDAIVKRNPITGSLYVIPALIRRKETDQDFSIHIICGAGTGTGLMKILAEMGFNLTVGVLNAPDTDYETAQLLNIPSVIEAPFSPISEENYRANLEIILRSDAVVISSVPFGYANLKNLEAAREAIKRGIPVIVLDDIPIEQRDFTKGEATEIIRELRDKGAVFVRNEQDLLNAIFYIKKNKDSVKQEVIR